MISSIIFFLKNILSYFGLFNKNGIVRLPRKEICEEYNYKTLDALIENSLDSIPHPLEDYHDYLAMCEIYVDGEWIVEAFKKEKGWEHEKPFFLIKGEWYPSEGKWLEYGLSEKEIRKAHKLKIKEIQSIIKRINK